MNDLNKKAFAGLLQFLISLAAFVFLPAWAVHYWQGWLFLAVFSASALLITLYLMKKDPKLLERRLNAGPGAEKQKRQRTIQFFASLGFISTIVVPAIDHRFRWSHLSTSLVIAGNVLVASGFLIIFRVFQENTFTSGVIEIDPEQKVISTGPYAIVRHPMYLGALIMLLGIPLALGSSWGLLTMIPMTYVIVWRLLEEEEFLAKNLPGYADYRNKVRYRLMPYIW